ncbi:MAG: hypothetical protein PHQ65_07295 [Bacteroidales bacterium]|nr:hypothetical protein [Bacteroidales bacterium]
MLYPFEDMSPAGWAASSTGYFWTLTLGVFSITLVRSSLYRKLKWWEYLLFICSMIYATNHEQMLIYMIPILIGFAVYTVYKHNPSITAWIGLTIAGLNAVYVFMAPGNQVRKNRAISIAIPDFNTYSILDKINMSFGYTMNHFLLRYDSVYFLFILLLFLAVMFLTREVFAILISAIPIVWAILVQIPGLNRIDLIFGEQVVITAINMDNMKNYLHIMIAFVILASIVSSLIMIFGNTWEFVLNLSVLAIGLVTRIALGFSPTIFRSHDRTLIFFYFSIIFVMINITQKQEIEKNINRKWINIVLVLYTLVNVGFLIYRLAINGGQIPKWG